MGVPLPLAELILREHKRLPLRGLALEFGKSTILLSPTQLRDLFNKLDLKPCSEEIEIDTKTVTAGQYRERGYISNTTFYQWLGLEKIHVLDTSDFEGADIIHDVCTPIPSSLMNKYDFVFDSSVLDNVFDPCAALRNMAAALKPGGRIIQINVVNSNSFPYLSFTCGWFLDYFAINEFARCQVYLAQYNSLEEHLYGPWTMWGCLPMSRQNLSAPAVPGSMSFAIVIAQKGANSTVDRNPIQGHYRSKSSSEFMDRQYERLMASSIPFHLAESNNPDLGGTQQINQWNWVYCGQYGELVSRVGGVEKTAA